MNKLEKKRNFSFSSLFSSKRSQISILFTLCWVLALSVIVYASFEKGTDGNYLRRRHLLSSDAHKTANAHATTEHEEPFTYLVRTMYYYLHWFIVHVKEGALMVHDCVSREG